MDNSINVQVGVGLRPNEIRKAIVKSVSYINQQRSLISLERICMVTEDGLKAEWEISCFCYVHMEEFCKTRDDILSGKITEGTEVIIEYNPSGIMCFYLEES